MTNEKEHKEELRTTQHKRAMIEALKEHLGIITKAAKDAGVGRKTHYLWIEKDPEYKKEVESIKDIAIDFVESKLMACINAKNITAIIFYLKNQAGHRGYLNEHKKDQEYDRPIKLIVKWGEDDSGEATRNKDSKD